MTHSGLQIYLLAQILSNRHVHKHLPPQRGHLVSGEPCGAWWALLCGLVELGSWVDTVGLDLFCGAPLFIRLCLNDHHWIQNTQVIKIIQSEVYIQESPQSLGPLVKKNILHFSHLRLIQIIEFEFFAFFCFKKNQHPSWMTLYKFV